VKKAKFILAIHNHQPVGNFEFVSEDAYQRAYLPFIEEIKAHPWFKFNLHYTGPLLKWLTEAHPEFIGTLHEMIAAGQVEMMTGGFYEPILALLPDTDKVGQIKKLTAFIKEKLGQDASSMWLAERVWEPHLPAAITEAGVKSVVVDDFHFKMSGLRDSELAGYYLTEDQGSALRVFPGSERLRYIIPFQPPETIIQHFRDLPDRGEHTLAVMADDGEKFGVWPGTHKWCYDEGWFRRFIKALDGNREWLTTTTFGEYMDDAGPLGTAYLPTCSYMEMGEWSLPGSAIKEYEALIEFMKSAPDFETRRLFIKGGFFRNFLSKYPESGYMHKRMLHVSGKVHKAIEARGGKALKEAMLDDLWQGQCNDSYWHGVFGGLYLPHLRDAVYRHLIKADEAAERLLLREKDDGWLSVEECDMDTDLATEVVVSNPLMSAVVDPGDGGCITEFDFRPVSMNLMNNLARRWEAYHDKIKGATVDDGKCGSAKTIHERVVVKEDGLSGMLQYDWYRRTSLIDHFLGPEADLDGFKRSDYHEAGDFVLGGYGHTVRKSKDKVKVTLSRRGVVLDTPVRVDKALTFGRAYAGFEADYALTNEGAEELNTTFGVEFNLSMLAGDASDRYYEIPGHVLKARNLRSSGELNNVREVRLVDEWLGYEILLTPGKTCTLWRFPVETVSQSEAGFERVYQSSAVMPLWRVSLKPGESWKVAVTFAVNMRKGKQQK